MIKQLLAKVFSKEFILYMLFGVVTTVVNYGIFVLLLAVLGDDWVLAANAVAFVASVLVAFVTNKPFVFKSYDWRPKTVTRELLGFVGSRLVTFFIEEAGLLVSQHLLGLGDKVIWGLNGLMVSKLALEVVVIVLNFVFSELIVFRKREED